MVDDGLWFMVCDEKEPRRISFSFFVSDSNGSCWFTMMEGTVAMNGSRLDHDDETIRLLLPSPLHFYFSVMFSMVNMGAYWLRQRLRSHRRWRNHVHGNPWVIRGQIRVTSSHTSSHTSMLEGFREHSVLLG